MFTGIVEAKGTIVSIEERAQLRAMVIRQTDPFQDTKLGDSIAVDGVCLTVTHFDADTLHFDVGAETLKLTTLGAIGVGDEVHLERAMRVNDRLGGHIVTGHVDATGTLAARHFEGETLIMRVHAPVEILEVSILKGSITVSGTSLTINAIDDHGFEVGLIPHTLEKTKLSSLKVGDVVNLESDVLGKYARRLLLPYRK